MIPTQHTVETPYMVGPVHVYTLELEDAYILIDTGPATPAGQAFVQEQVDLDRLSHVLITHCHIDHYGQAGWLAANSDAVVYLPRRDILKHELKTRRMEGLFALVAELGFTEPYVVQLRERFSSTMMPLFPEQYGVAEHLPAALGIEVLECPGHSQSDLVFVGDDWAVTGDTLLRGVFQSPLLDVDLERGGRFKNYEAYCSSIVKLAGLATKTILPGHRFEIDSVGATILFYISKTLQRLHRLAPYLRERTVAQVIEDVFPTMSDSFHVYLKSSEILFMKDLLEQPELLSSALTQIDLYDQVAELFESVLDQELRLDGYRN